MKLDVTTYFQCAKDDVKSVKQRTRTRYLKKTYVPTQEIRPECKVCELRYQPIGTMFVIQEYNLLFPIPKKCILIFIIYCFKTNIIFLVNSSNLIHTIKTIIVLIELQLNSTVNS